MLNHRAALRGIAVALLAAGSASAQKGGGEAPGLCLVAEYIYAGSRLLAVDRGSVKPTVSFSAAVMPPSPEGSPGTPRQAAVAVKVTTPGACPTGGVITVQYSTTATGTATPGTDYTVATNATLTIPVGTPSDGITNILIALAPDALDEDDETFGVVLSGPVGATLGTLTATTAIIQDDDPSPTIAINDVITNEPTSGFATASYTVTLSTISGRTVTASFATADGTATGLDYVATSGALTFLPGVGSRPLDVFVRDDNTDEPNETYFVNLTNAVNVEPVGSDFQGQGTIVDSDPPPNVSVFPSSRFEGDEGVNRMDFIVSLSAASGFPITVNYSTADNTATAPSDYIATSGQVSFAPGDTLKQPLVDIVPDGIPEPNETFFFNLSGPVNANLGTSQAMGFINNDDPLFQPSFELTNGSRVTRDLQPVGGVAARHWYRFGQRARSSYEAVVDATSGDVGAAYGLELKRIAPDLVTVRGEATAVTPGPSGEGRSKTMRWRNFQQFGVHGEFITVNSASCTTNCGPDDVYRIRFYDTTYAVPRFNNTGSQVTLLIIQNVGSRSFGGTVDFWDANGVYLGSQPFFVLEPRSSFVLNTALAMAGQSGSMTIMHEGGYGDLVGKAVSIEPATGYSFDTPIVPRPR